MSAYAAMCGLYYGDTNAQKLTTVANIRLRGSRATVTLYYAPENEAVAKVHTMLKVKLSDGRIHGCAKNNSRIKARPGISPRPTGRDPTRSVKILVFGI